MQEIFSQNYEKNHSSRINSNQDFNNEIYASVPEEIKDIKPMPSLRIPSESYDIEKLFPRRRLSFEESTQFSGGPVKRSSRKIAAWSIVAALIDSFIVISLTSLFAISFLVITKANRGQIGEFFAFYLVALGWMYLVCSRVFMGYSIGEEACDLRIGTAQQRLAPNYVLRVILRSTLVMITGYVLLPMFSLLTGRDWAGVLSGVEVKSLK